MTQRTESLVTAATAPEHWAAVLWDLDGTLLDTEHYWQGAEWRLATDHGATWSTEHALNLVGSDLMDSARYIREHMQIELEPEEITQRLISDVLGQLREEITWRPGAHEQLLSLSAAGVRQGLVTMSYASLVAPVLASLPDGLFEVVVTGDVVARGKPHPDPYLQAADALGVAPDGCLVVEDSETGTRSAIAAGCHVLVVPHHVRVADGDKRRFVSSLVDADLLDVGRFDVSSGQRS
jgi:HAD superfamily hydrolase (TIGR01509 family)